jgi:serine/threonine-protein kinase
VLFELLVGHPPFVGDSPVSVAYQHVREDPRAPSDINPEVPPDVDAIVLKALAKNPLNRYQSAQEMRADALRAVSGRPVLATPVMSQAETMAMSGPPMRTPPAATTVTRPVPGGPPRPPDRKTSSWVMAVLAALGVLAVIALAVGLYLSQRDNTETPPATVVTMPNLDGLSEEEATTKLDQLKFTNVSPAPAKETNDCGETPSVVAQTPAANTRIAVDQPVTYTLCKAPDQVTVPKNLVGSTKDAANDALTGINLDPDFDEVDSAQPEGRVVEVEKAGQQVEVGTKIKVKISKGNLVEVPNVVGQSQVAAEALLRASQFEVRVRLVDQDGEPGTVVDQDPPAKRARPKGSTVTIEVIDQQQPDPDDSGTPGPDDPTPPGGNDGGGNGAGNGNGNGLGGILNRP